MFGSDVLEVVIGLAFVCLAASLICTAIKEGLEAILRRRGLFLKQALGELLSGPEDQSDEGRSWVQRFYDHPLINSLYLGRYNATKPTNLPSYIPSGSFASTIMDLVSREASTRARKAAETERERAGATREEVAAAGLAAAVAHHWDSANPLESLRKCVGALAEGHLKDSLTVVLKECGPELADVKAGIEHWFNESMNRVSGVYKRHAQKMIFLIAAVVTFSLNLNVVLITRKLITDSALRKTLVAQAETYAKVNAAPLAPPSSENPFGTHAPAASSTNAPVAVNRIESTVSHISSLGLPIGWDQFTPPDLGRGWGRLLLGWLGLLAGYLATIFALTLGAPFWFDVLNKVIQVRGAVSPSKALKKKNGTDE